MSVPAPVRAPVHAVARASVRASFRARWRAVALALAGAVAAHAAVAQGIGCGGLANNYGPYDYRQYKDMPEIDPVTKQMSPLQMVEGAHFIDTCEALVKCKRGSIGSDIDYTLRAFPNHHRALIAMMLYGERTKRDQPPEALFTVDCYFKRALTWKADDVIVRLIYAGYLNGKGKTAAAKEQLEAANKLWTTFMAELGCRVVHSEVDLAVDAARRAYGAGMTHPILRQRLMAINRWPADLRMPGEAASAAEPSPAAASASGPSASAAAPPASAPETAVPAAPAR